MIAAITLIIIDHRSRQYTFIIKKDMEN